MVDKLRFLTGLDLNLQVASGTVPAILAAGSLDASTPARLCAAHAPSSAQHVSSLRGALRRRAQGQELLLSGSVSVHGLCAADLSGKPARYRGVPASTVLQALSLGNPGFDRATLWRTPLLHATAGSTPPC